MLYTLTRVCIYDADGGHDYIPKTIDEYHEDEFVDVFVYENGDNDDASVTALIIGKQEPGSCAYTMWGARTHPKHRGKGIMKIMMDYIRERAYSVDGTRYIVSTTIHENVAMRHIFKQHGYKERSVVYGWPNSKLSEHFVSKSASFGDAMFVKNTLHPAKCALMWRRVLSSDDLVNALSVLRCSDPFDNIWIPGSYETVIVDGGLETTGDAFVGYVDDLPVAVIARLEDQLGREIGSVVYNNVSLANHIVRSCLEILGDSISRLYIDTCSQGHPMLHGTRSMIQNGWLEYQVLTHTLCK